MTNFAPTLKDAYHRFNIFEDVTICETVANVSKDPAITIEIKNMINSRLNGFSYAHNWLGAIILFGPSIHRDDLSEEQLQKVYDWKHTQRLIDIQKWRKGWLLELLEEFADKESYTI